MSEELGFKKEAAEILNNLTKALADNANATYALASAYKGVPIPDGVIPDNTEQSDESPIKKAMEAFDEDLRGMLNFSEEGNVVIVKPKRFLGSDNFAKIGAVVRKLGGEYLSQGKASHFEVPKNKL